MCPDEHLRSLQRAHSSAHAIIALSVQVEKLLASMPAGADADEEATMMWVPITSAMVSCSFQSEGVTLMWSSLIFCSGSVFRCEEVTLMHAIFALVLFLTHENTAGSANGLCAIFCALKVHSCLGATSVPSD